METNDKGQLAMDLKPGGYALFVNLPGFKSVATHIEVHAAKEVQTIPVHLELAPTGPPTAIFPACTFPLIPTTKT